MEPKTLTCIHRTPLIAQDEAGDQKKGEQAEGQEPKANSPRSTMCRPPMAENHKFNGPCREPASAPVKQGAKYCYLELSA